MSLRIAKLRKLPPFGTALATALLALTVVACGDDGGPFASDVVDGRASLLVVARAQGPALLPAALEPARLQAIVRTPDGTEVVKDTALAVTAGQELSLNLSVEVDGPDQEFLLELLLRSGDGTLVFQAGPLPVIARLPGSGSTPQQLTLTYVGPGADAVELEIVPAESRLVFGETRSLAIRTRSAAGAELGSVPVEWSTLDPTLVALDDEAAGRWRALEGRGEARVVAELEPVGLADTALIAVFPPAGELRPVSGDGQSGGAGVPLPEPLVVRVLGTDGLPLEGQEVAFAPGQDGVAEPEVALSDAEGFASAVWTPGPLVGTQTLTASVVSDAGLTASFSAEVGPAPLAQITLTPSEIVFDALTATRQLIPEGRDGFGNLVELEAVEWSSSAPTIARVNQNGVVTAVANGQADITATSEGVTSVPAQVTVSQIPVSLTVIPPSGWTLGLNQTLDFRAEGRDRLNQPVRGIFFQWSSSDPAVAALTTSSLAPTVQIRGVADGPVTIRARVPQDTLIGGTSSGTVVDTPDPPSDVEVTAFEDEGADLFGYEVLWIDNSDDEGGFRVERSLNAGATWQFAGNVGDYGSEPSFFDSGPSTGWPGDRRVLHRVSACRGDSCSPPATSTVIQYTAPNEPASVSATQSSATFAVTGTWPDPNTFEAGYEVELWEVCFGPDEFLEEAILPANATSHTFVSPDGGGFEVRVRARGRGPFDSDFVISNFVGVCIGEQ